MSVTANRLRQAVEQRKDELKSELMRYGYFKTPDGLQLYELTLTELEQIHINVKCEFGREMSKVEGA
ncbi:Fur-regulated basic protein FbpA [Metabacillus idriensis]|uniref:Fur-regulated basic protein FbpA n=1 Tax=Metabacillus idriensis TaxID=324768 RepID=UPI00203F90A0|nr:Fur-regulated basic protein FbpA [Metabacillus idriensis]MCM3598677.1 Fur-regulated basic protein FbpA [Metabacillus idriensis]